MEKMARAFSLNFSLPLGILLGLVSQHIPEAQGEMTHCCSLMPAEDGGGC